MHLYFVRNYCTPYSHLFHNLQLSIACSLSILAPFKIVACCFDALGKEHLVIDLIYNPEKTLFLERAQKQQATILNGASMLKEQAMESWRLWNK